MRKKAIITKEQALQAVYERTEAKGNLETINAQIGIEESQVREKYSENVGNYEQQMQEADAIIEKYVESNRDDLFEDGAKSVALGSAKVGFRLKPAKVAFLEGWDLKSVIKKLKNRHPDLVITKTSEGLDKRKVIAAATDKLKGKIDAYGIKIEQEEIFYIK